MLVTLAISGALVGQVGVGLQAWEEEAGEPVDLFHAIAPAPHGFVAYRVHANIEIGARLGMWWMREAYDDGDFGISRDIVVQKIAFDVGGVARVSDGRWWGTPWVGVRNQRTHEEVTECRDVAMLTCDPSVEGEFRESSHWDFGMAAGLAVGVDLVDVHGHAAGIYLDAIVAEGHRACGIGIVFR